MSVQKLPKENAKVTDDLNYKLESYGRQKLWKNEYAISLYFIPDTFSRVALTGHNLGELFSLINNYSLI